ncbi:MAG: cytochrome c3 family protein [Methanosarcinales archaeon]
MTIANAYQNSANDGVTNSILAKHTHEMGGPNHECVDCHNGIKASEPVALPGRYTHMGGPNHSCEDCHNGVKAPELPLPPGYTSCGDCHPSK